MCCEVCPRYEKCEDNNLLRDNCCSKCPDYNGCIGIDMREGRSFRGSYEDDNEEDYF